MYIFWAGTWAIFKSTNIDFKICFKYQLLISPTKELKYLFIWYKLSSIPKESSVWDLNLCDMSKLLIVVSLAFAILALESNGATFAPFGIHLKGHHFDFQTHKGRFINPRMIIRGLKLIKNHPVTKYEKEMQKFFQPKVENLQQSEAKKMIDYMTIRKIWKTT